MKKAYCIVQILQINDPIKFEQYVEGHIPTILKYGGKFLVKGKQPKILEGQWEGNRVVIHEFPSFSQLQAWYYSEDYLPWKKLRQASAQVNVIITEGT